uniref:Uncharacterized protein n=1 Tax=Triticum urartu TaxID=4572 RepID=A0A8R7TFI4_TRIUA
MPPELHHPIGRRPRRHEVAGIAQFAVGEGASDASEAAASSTYASPWGSLCCWRTARPRWCGARLPDHPTAGVGGWHSHNSSSGDLCLFGCLGAAASRELADGVQYIDKAKVSMEQIRVRLLF